MLTNPFDPIQATGLLTLIDSDAQVDQNDYGASVEIALDAVAGSYANKPISGEILHATFISTETGTGAVRIPAGVLFLLSTDPAVTAGDTAMIAAAHASVIGQIEVETTDWKADANGATAAIYNKPIAFHALTSIWAVWFHEDATSLNDAAGDDELLRVNLWIRRDT